MKKIFKTLAVCAVAGTLCAGVAAMAGCAEKTETFTGEYKYANAWTPSKYYGVKVEVTVKGDKISEVKLVDCDYTVVTSTWGDSGKWTNGIEGLLGQYVGKTVDEVKKIEVKKEANGQPSDKQELGGLLITGATQGSGRLLLAVQNALNELETREAWGLVHGAGYAGYATITYKAGAISDVTLSEVCLPTYVTAGSDVADDYKVTATINSHGKPATKVFYKTVKYDTVTMTYDATLDSNGYSKGYMIGDKTLVEYFQTEKNVEVYYNAVMNNAVSVVVGKKADNSDEVKKDVMTKKALSKEENGYWANDTHTGYDSAWKWNRDLTVKYVKEHGVENLLKLKKDETTNTWKEGTIDTGATWTDLNSDTTGKGYLSYAQLIKKASDAKK